MAICKMGIQTPMVQGRSTEIISMIPWIRSSRLPMKNFLSVQGGGDLRGLLVGGQHRRRERLAFRFWSLVFGVWGVGRGVWGLGFGVWGFGLWDGLDPAGPRRVWYFVQILGTPCYTEITAHLSY